MKLFPTLAAWLLLVSLAHSATVTFIQTAVNDADGTTIGALSSTQSLATGVSVSTVTAPPTFNNYRVTHWTNSSYPAVRKVTGLQPFHTVKKGRKKSPRKNMKFRGKRDTT